jgi:multidrug resistance efflux pump
MATFAQTERLGFALRRLAEDLAAEQRRVRLLQREVRELKAQLAAAQSTIGSEAGETSPGQPAGGGAARTPIR